MSDLPNIPTPCVGVCTLEPETRLCAGCLRTAMEIAMWPGATNEERLAIVNALRERRRARGITSAADSRPRRRAALPHAG
ncbi:MAG: DUF1289 domain-containing protein [Geminicoccaceae bacterium]